MELSKALDRGRRVGTYSPNPGNRKWDDLMVVRASRRREAKVKLVGWSKERLSGPPRRSFECVTGEGVGGAEEHSVIRWCSTHVYRGSAVYHLLS